jgi:hypothetical protein
MFNRTYFETMMSGSYETVADLLSFDDEFPTTYVDEGEAIPITEEEIRAFVENYN